MINGLTMPYTDLAVLSSSP